MEPCINCLGARVRFIEIEGEYTRVPCLTCDPHKANFEIHFYGPEDDDRIETILADCFTYAAAKIEQKKRNRTGKEGNGPHD